jgi:hypothetical protein
MKKIRGYENPFPECENCKTLLDCKHVEVTDDMMGSPLPPESCLKPMDIMKNTLKLRKGIKGNG